MEASKLCKKTADVNSLFGGFISGAAAGTLPTSRGNGLDPHAESVIATVTVVTEHHLVLQI